MGAAFLEESFSSRSASLAGRVHEKAARSVLSALLPDTGVEIKGYRRPQQALLQVSGYTRYALLNLEFLYLHAAPPPPPFPAPGVDPTPDNLACVGR